MTHLSIPSDWPSPKFHFNQRVRVQGIYEYTGRIIGFEYLDADHYHVVVDGYDQGWSYTVQVDLWCPKGHLEPVLMVEESRITALTPALVC